MIEKNIIKKKLNIANISLITVGAILLVFLATQYYQKLKTKQGNQNIKNESLEEDFFDISDEYKKTENKKDEDLPDITATELQEKGADFFYRVFLKNQVQINALQDEIANLRSEFTNYKNSEKSIQIIFSYIELREQLFKKNFSDLDFQKSFENFDVITRNDSFISERVNKLRVSLLNIKTQTEILQMFEKLIPEIIATKKFDKNDGWFNNFRHYLAKTIVVRKIDDKNLSDIDGIISSTEQMLKKENYNEALNIFIKIDEKYSQISQDFISTLKDSSEIQKIDKEIFLYLKNLK
ncbi:MAG: hypothetical protein LW595_05035 [Rickettsiales bacterium]|nr:hypothetical protein [Rickettsiales bacterium]